MWARRALVTDVLLLSARERSAGTASCGLPDGAQCAIRQLQDTHRNAMEIFQDGELEEAVRDLALAQD